jgi:RNA polymerase sigma-70 factor (ECF subfamily)
LIGLSIAISILIEKIWQRIFTASIPNSGMNMIQHTQKEKMMFAQSSLIAETGRLQRFAFKLTRNRSDAEDLVQSTCLRALEKNESFEDGSNLFGWTSKIMYNLFVSAYRRRNKFESQYDPEIYLEKETIMPMQDIILEVENVKRAMAMLSKDHRNVLIMICANGMSYQEVADELSISIGTVRSRLFRARERVQNILNDLPTRPILSSLNHYQQKKYTS